MATGHSQDNAGTLYSIPPEVLYRYPHRHSSHRPSSPDFFSGFLVPPFPRSQGYLFWKTQSFLCPYFYFPQGSNIYHVLATFPLLQCPLLFKYHFLSPYIFLNSTRISWVRYSQPFHQRPSREHCLGEREPLPLPAIRASDQLNAFKSGNYPQSPMHCSMVANKNELWTFQVYG